jgi:membrane fusion protein (multidrug efflux system)
VNAASGTLLTRIEQIDPIYVNFAQSSAELLALREQISSGALKLSGLDRVPVHVVLEDGSVYSHPGRVDFLDLRIDEATGTAALRAEVPNPERVLLPGQFVRARLEAGVQANGLLIPQRAVLITPEGSSVMVVGEKNVAESRPVTIGALQGGSWQILKGLSAGDRVIVDGLQKTRAGEPVRVATDAPATDRSARVSR